MATDVQNVTKLKKDGVNMAWTDIKRNPFRATKQASKARKQRFYRIDLPQLLAECEILTESNKFGYCQIKQVYTNIEELIK